MDSFEKYAMDYHHYEKKELIIDKERNKIKNFEDNIYLFDKKKSKEFENLIKKISLFELKNAFVYKINKTDGSRLKFYNVTTKFLYYSSFQYQIIYTFEIDDKNNDYRLDFYIYTKNSIINKGFHKHFDSQFLENVKILTKKALEYFQNHPEIRLKIILQEKRKMVIKIN